MSEHISEHISEQLTGKQASVCAVIVTYNPVPAALNALLQLIIPQVDKIVVVDNASSIPIDSSIAGGGVIHLIRNKKNEGIAAAHNSGIDWAIGQACTHVIIFDQDSEPGDNMVEQLLIGEARLIEQGYQVAAVGPVFSDVKIKAEGYFCYIESFKLKKKFVPDFDGFAEATYLISSGQMIRCDILKQVGGMCASLFIDYVDIEWGLRAGTMGYKSFGIFAAKMVHDLGDDTVRVGKRTITLHSPLRHYYIMRNAILLYRSAKIPFNWKFVDGLRFLPRFFSYLLLSDNRLAHLKYMLSGILDGLRGRRGAYGSHCNETAEPKSMKQ